MYCKLFASLYQGTLRGKSHEILVFTNLLAHCDKEGFVDKHFKAIAEEIGLTVDEVKKAVETLESPDLESRSQEFEGARLERIEAHRNWGWRIVNYIKYREIRDEDERREYNRIRQSERRAKLKNCDSSKMSLTVIDKTPMSQMSQNVAHVEEEVQAKAKERTLAHHGGFESFWMVYPKKKAKGKARAAFEKALKMVSLEEILLSIGRLSVSQDWLKEDGKYVPYPASWLNAEGWYDQPGAFASPKINSEGVEVSKFKSW